MTKEPTAEPRGVDVIVDETIAAMTSVEAFERRTLASLHQRLREDAPQRLAVRALIFRPAVALTLAVAVCLMMVAGVTLLQRARSSEPRVAQQQDDGTPKSAPAAPIAHRPSAPERHVASAGDVAGARAVKPRAPRSLRAGPQRPPSTPPQPDRLLAFLRAIQQLPPDVWERLDTAGPPAVPSLDVGEASPLPPLTVDPLRTTEWPAADPAADTNPSGGYR